MKASEITKETHKPRQLYTLTEALAFTAGKTPVDEDQHWTGQYSFRLPHSTQAAIVVFRDDTALLVLAEYDGGYSELTPGEGASTSFWAMEKR